MTLLSADLSAVKELPLFAELPRALQPRLLKNARLHHFGAGSVLFREGESPEHIHVALDGQVALRSSTGGGDLCVVEFVPIGEPFILAAVMLDKPYLMTADVVQAGRILLIPAAEFRKCADTELSLARALNRSAARNWRALIGQIKSLKMQTGAQRLAVFLLSLTKNQAGEVIVDLPCERRVLATWLGIVPSSASRAFRELETLGVEGRGASLRIRSVKRLAEYAGLNP